MPDRHPADVPHSSWLFLCADHGTFAARFAVEEAVRGCDPPDDGRAWSVGYGWMVPVDARCPECRVVGFDAMNGPADLEDEAATG